MKIFDEDLPLKILHRIGGPGFSSRRFENIVFVDAKDDVRKLSSRADARVVTIFLTTSTRVASWLTVILEETFFSKFFSKTTRTIYSDLPNAKKDAVKVPRHLLFLRFVISRQSSFPVTFTARFFNEAFKPVDITLCFVINHYGSKKLF